jgi:hypothetical protein
MVLFLARRAIIIDKDTPQSGGAPRKIPVKLPADSLQIPGSNPLYVCGFTVDLVTAQCAGNAQD